MNEPNQIQVQASCLDDVEDGIVSVEQALQQLLQKTSPVSGYQNLPLRDCFNRVLYEDIISPIDVPSHTNSAMDGYAVRSEDLPNSGTQTLEVVGKAFAGQPFTDSCQAGQCVRIMTGAVLPPDTDCVVIQEHVERIDDSTIRIDDRHRKHQNIRFAGEDVQKDGVVLKKGTLVKAAELGVLASLGVNEIRVFRRPRVSFFSTGDELRSIGEALKEGDIYDSNRYSLYGLLQDCHVDVIDLGVVRDDPDALRDTLLAAAANSDLVLTSGGVSVGEADYIKSILKDIGEIDFWKIAMKPGRPLTVGTINNSLFLGLPGNPVAVMVTFYQFVVPCLQVLSGREFTPAPLVNAISVDSIRKNPGRMEYQRGIASQSANGQIEVQLTGRQGSGILTSMSRANCFVVLAVEQGPVASGDTVSIQYFHH